MKARSFLYVLPYQHSHWRQIKTSVVFIIIITFLCHKLTIKTATRKLMCPIWIQHLLSWAFLHHSVKKKGCKEALWLKHLLVSDYSEKETHHINVYPNSTGFTVGFIKKKSANDRNECHCWPISDVNTLKSVRFADIFKQLIVIKLHSNI